MCVNVPILRTLGYVQINIHVVNLILLCLLFYPKYAALSALALTLAAHLKVSPVILVLPFLLRLDWKWLGYFTIFNLGIIITTCALTGVKYYWSWLDNLSQLPGGAFRENSIDSFIVNTFNQLSLHLNYAQYLISFLKIAIILFCFGIIYSSIKSKFFFQSNDREHVVFNSFVVVLFLMVLLSPLIWVHHLVFLIFPFILILKKISNFNQLMIYGIAYILLFLVPTFDFYPFSYIRLTGIMLCLGLLYISTEHDSILFEKINRYLNDTHSIDDHPS